MTSPLLALQTFHVAFLALHNWIPLGRLNDVRAVPAANAGASLLVTTILSAAPYAAGLATSLAHLHGAYPPWARTWLWVSQGAWWVPHLEGKRVCLRQVKCPAPSLSRVFNLISSNPRYRPPMAKP